MKRIKSYIKLSMEELTDGVVRNEIERVIYVKISDFEQLKNAESKEYQEQWTIKSNLENTTGTLRVRKSTIDDKTTYVQTSKVKYGMGQNKEVSMDVTDGMFDIFKMICPSGMIKDRFKYPVGNRCFEVDVFIKDDGSYHEWGKIDFEVESMEESVPELPIKVDQVIMDNTENPEEKEMIKNLYETVFITKNKGNQEQAA